jgi:hypothetical protein
MRAYTQTSDIRPLGATELDDVNGGAIFVGIIIGVGIGFGLGLATGVGAGRYGYIINGLRAAGYEG